MLYCVLYSAVQYSTVLYSPHPGAGKDPGPGRVLRAPAALVTPRTKEGGSLEYK